jgi:hypothetical protein
MFSKNSTHGALAVTALTALLFWPQPAAAVDTVEIWEPGATNLDFYTNYNGLGLSRSERELGSEIMAGFGVINGLSAYLGAAMGADELFSQGSGEIFAGIYGTPFDSDHFDLDLFLDFRLGGAGLGEFQVAPAVELNFDVAPDLQLWGMYLVVAAPVYGRTVGEADATTTEVATHLETTLGTYVTIAERHQILLDYEMAWRPMAAADETDIEVGSIGLGYNVFLTPALELITEVRFDIPQEDEAFSVGFMVGFIGTMPPADV